MKWVQFLPNEELHPFVFFVCLHIMLSRTTLMRQWNIRVVYVVSTEFFAQ